jgi:hypothetical protein
MPSIVQTLVNDLRLVALGPVRPTRPEFEQHIAQALAWEPQVRCVLVSVAEGGALEAQERVALAKAGLLAKPCAVLVKSPLTRSILTAVRWLGGAMSAFAPDELERACEHLEIARAQRPAVRAQLHVLSTKVAPERSAPKPR